jgi:hypothetical protein
VEELILILDEYAHFFCPGDCCSGAERGSCSCLAEVNRLSTMLYQVYEEEKVQVQNLRQE